MPRAEDLTTTSFAVLGLLAVQPWSSYRLTRQMDRSLGRFWPRARSKLYEEPKKLVAAGLAIGVTERSAGRPRPAGPGRGGAERRGAPRGVVGGTARR